MARYMVYEHEDTKKRKEVKEGFRWLCFLFGPFWYFANGMIGKGLLWLIAAIVAGLIILGVGAGIIWIIAGFVASGEVQSKLRKDGWKFVGYRDELAAAASADSVPESVPEKVENPAIDPADSSN